jgi:Rrf2 family transcriptional regulator, nitric oxide-sensitive transcriptional repressor
MRLTTYTDYSLRLLMYLAAEPGRRATIAEVATAYGISENHLTKVAHGLGRLGWLATVRGQGGGLELARPAQQVGIGQVVRGTEGGDLPAACFGDPPAACTIACACQLRGVLAEAVEAFYAALDRHTLADLVRQPRALSRLLFIAPPPTRRRRSPAKACA